ncbi:GDSL esterase/lipase At5g55050-like [Phragmites australis]|uniref:GDSL esterase/lipase At5g55050-like n=1 Tax=Phragmites australis TaxID=29695 RepID=UPI002D7925DB|nr:GDSL esterase/lipase At5g55050-like [Phragmites australis]
MATMPVRVLHVLLAVAAACAAAPAASAAAGNNKVPAIYVFGDSTADVGNNNYLPGSAVPRANFPHNGVDFPTSRPTGRFSNGYNGIDFLALNMGFKRSPPPFLAVANKTNKQILRGLLGVNFASAGSGILDTTGNFIIPMSKQVEQFATVQCNISARISKGAADSVLSRSLFLISTGGNDLFAFFSRNSTPSDTDKQLFVANLVSLCQNHVKALYVLGARKFAVIDVPPIGCCPYPRSLHPLGACIDALNELARGFNKGVKAAMHDLSVSLQGFKYSIGSSHAVVQSIMKHPQRLGFKEVTTACCGSGRFNGGSECTPNATLCDNRHEYLFWDLLHPTHATSKLAAAAIYNGSLHFASPINFRQLVEDQY